MDIQPLNLPEPGTPRDPNADMAADVIRAKLQRLYAEEPDAGTEAREAAVQPEPARSKHQQFMYELSNSGKDLATIQTEWHNYYLNLPDHEKHEVWQEFYSSQSSVVGTSAVSGQPPHAGVVVSSPDPQQFAEHKHEAVAATRKRTKQAKNGEAAAKSTKKPRDTRTLPQVQEAIRDKVTAGGKLKAKHHLQAILFGLGVASLLVFIVLFGFFNEVFIAPFIQPSRTAAATPIIVSNSTVAASPNPEIIIPKINVQIPVDYSQTTTDEAQIENALESGIVHYPTTARPGEKGNAAFFGHSSNNIFNKGKYKFAFVLLHTLVEGDTFYLNYNSKVYVYKVISKTVVDPSNVGVLDPIPGETATATLITCDPPGTSLKRLIVVGRQISPDPSGNTAAAAPTTATTAATTTELPGNGPTLFGKLMRSTAGKIIGSAVILLAIIAILRWVNKPRD